MRVLVVASVGWAPYAQGVRVCGGVWPRAQVLGSTLGRFDGNVYEALYEGATKSRLNHVQPFQGYKEHLQPNLDLNLLKLKNSLLPEAKL